MRGPCMCGDPYCPQCSGYYGNYKCPACGTWSFDGECPDPVQCEKKLKKMDEDQYIDYLVDEIYNNFAAGQGLSIWEVEPTPDLTAKIRNLINTNNIEELEILAGKKERKTDEN